MTGQNRPSGTSSKGGTGSSSGIQNRKQLSGQTDSRSSTPANENQPSTRAKGNRSTEIFNPLSAVNTAEEGLRILHDNRMIIQDNVVDKQALVMALFHIAQDSSKIPQTTVDYIRAVAFLLQDAEDTQIASNIATRTMAILEAPIRTFAETTEGWMQTAQKVIDMQTEQDKRQHDLIAKCTDSIQQMQTLLTKTTEMIDKATSAQGALNTPRILNHPTTYAAAVTAKTLGVRLADPNVNGVLSKAELLARRVYVGPTEGSPVDTFHKLSDEVLISKADMAVQIMTESGTLADHIKTPIKFISVKRLGNGGVVYEINTNEAAQWIKKPEVMEAFVNSYASNASSRPNGYLVIVENVPLYFDPENIVSKEKIAKSNDIQANDILEARFVKPPQQRKEGQRTGHVFFKMRTRETANILIEKGTVIEHRRADTRKMLDEVLRCMKCQRLNPGHKAANCPSQHDVCATCAGHHRTLQCPNKEKHRCANCVTDGHPAWSKNCPSYLRKLKEMINRNPENRYKYFVTADTKTWVLTDPDETDSNGRGLPPHFQQAQQRQRTPSQERGRARYRSARAVLNNNFDDTTYEVNRNKQWQGQHWSPTPSPEPAQTHNASQQQTATQPPSQSQHELSTQGSQDATQQSTTQRHTHRQRSRGRGRGRGGPTSTQQSQGRRNNRSPLQELSDESLDRPFVPRNQAANRGISVHSSQSARSGKSARTTSSRTSQVQQQTIDSMLRNSSQTRSVHSNRSTQEPPPPELNG